MKMKVRFCPLCGHHGQKLVSSTFEGLHKDDEGSPCVPVTRVTWQVECQCCGARGPIEFDAECALDSWNFRHVRPAHEDDPEWIDFIYETESETKNNGKTKKEC